MSISNSNSPPPSPLPTAFSWSNLKYVDGSININTVGGSDDEGTGQQQHVSITAQAFLASTPAVVGLRGSLSQYLNVPSSQVLVTSLQDLPGGAIVVIDPRDPVNVICPSSEADAAGDVVASTADTELTDTIGVEVTVAGTRSGRRLQSTTTVVAAVADGVGFAVPAPSGLKISFRFLTCGLDGSQSGSHQVDTKVVAQALSSAQENTALFSSWVLRFAATLGLHNATASALSVTVDAASVKVFDPASSGDNGGGSSGGGSGHHIDPNYVIIIAGVLAGFVMIIATVAIAVRAVKRKRAHDASIVDVLPTRAARAAMQKRRASSVSSSTGAWHLSWPTLPSLRWSGGGSGDAKKVSASHGRVHASQLRARMDLGLWSPAGPGLSPLTPKTMRSFFSTAASTNSGAAGERPGGPRQLHDRQHQQTRPRLPLRWPSLLAFLPQKGGTASVAAGGPGGRPTDPGSHNLARNGNGNGPQVDFLSPSGKRHRNAAALAHGTSGAGASAGIVGMFASTDTDNTEGISDGPYSSSDSGKFGSGTGIGGADGRPPLGRSGNVGGGHRDQVLQAAAGTGVRVSHSGPSVDNGRFTAAAQHRSDDLGHREATSFSFRSDDGRSEQTRRRGTSGDTSGSTHGGGGSAAAARSQFSAIASPHESGGTRTESSLKSEQSNQLSPAGR